MDRRIGENDNNMSYEEKMLARFQKTRQVRNTIITHSDRDQFAYLNTMVLMFKNRFI